MTARAAVPATVNGALAAPLRRDLHRHHARACASGGVRILIWVGLM